MSPSKFKNILSLIFFFLIVIILSSSTSSFSIISLITESSYSFCCLLLLFCCSSIVKIGLFLLSFFSSSLLSVPYISTPLKNMHKTEVAINVFILHFVISFLFFIFTIKSIISVCYSFFFLYKIFLHFFCDLNETRTRDLLRDRQAF